MSCPHLGMALVRVERWDQEGSNRLVNEGYYE